MSESRQKKNERPVNGVLGDPKLEVEEMKRNEQRRVFQ